MILLFLVALVFAEDSNTWRQLQQARLMMMDKEQIEASIDLLNQIIAQSEPDDFIVSEAEYWKGRALYELNYHNHAFERLNVASNDYAIRSDALYFLQQSAAWKRRVKSLPYEGNPWINLDGKPSRKHSLFWVGTLDVQASSVSKISLQLDSEEFPIFVTMELVDWRNERWVWRGLVPDASQPLELRLEQFRSPRDDRQYWYRNILVTAESQDGRRVPIVVTNTRIE